MEKTGEGRQGLTRLGPAQPRSPVILSVPHAGRFYPPALIENSRCTPAALRSLEDRHVDGLVMPLAERGYTIIVTRTARAWIDINRSEREIDPEMIFPQPVRAGLDASVKVRGGLGLVPRRLAGHGNIYRRPISNTDLAARIRDHHRPYHAALSDALDAARSRYGAALLLDCHSMPPLAPVDRARGADIVIGDRDGRSAAPAYSARAATVCREEGFSVARNEPYAGGYILARHGRPEREIHALQFEICRSLYLDFALDRPGRRFDAIAALVGRVADALTETLLSPAQMLAAE